ADGAGAVDRAADRALGGRSSGNGRGVAAEPTLGIGHPPWLMAEPLTPRMRRLRPAFLAIALSCRTAAPPPPSPAQVDLVESTPLETPLDHPDIPDAQEVWPAMIRGATRTLDIAQFYVSDAPESRLSPVLREIEAAAERGVAVRLLA